LRDSIEIEWAGRPSVAIIADALVGAAEMMKRVSGMPDYPYVVTPFPISNLTSAELRERARVMVPDILRLLTQQRPATADAATPHEG
jgi:hypothetical protein